MFFKSQNPTWGSRAQYVFLRSLDFAYAAQLIGGTLNPKVRLFAGNLTFNSNTGLPVFTAAQATFDGYVPVAITSLTDTVGWNGPTLIRIANSAFFEWGSPFVAGQNVNGYYVTTETAGTPDTWWVAESFPSPVPMASSGDFIELTVCFGLTFAPTLIPG